ncbi:Retrotransposon gag protein [Abeliophyllum distichum]|uniref:Retrotransposon gag protein n=1 Tax=Abeliophyllum distichum TaxID=126358 RepID=A0ABD1SSJ3_9LAMI
MKGHPLSNEGDERTPYQMREMNGHPSSLTAGPNPYWGQPSWMPTPTLVETPVLSLEQRLEELMGRKIAKAMSSKSSMQQFMVLEEDPFSLEVMTSSLPRDFKQPKMEKYDGSSEPVDHLSLMQLARDKDELLKDFIARFNRATLGIKDLQMSAVVTAMMSGTQSRLFKMSLSKNPPNTMHELLRRGEKYVDAEEAYLITKNLKKSK